MRENQPKQVVWRYYIPAQRLHPGEKAMNFSATSRQFGNVVVLDLTGQLTIGEPVLHFRNSLRSLVSSGNRYFVINLNDVAYVDSSGLGELLAGYTTVRARNGEMKLLNLPARVQDLLHTTMLETVFKVYTNESEAIRALESHATGSQKPLK